jgi:tRNA (cytidine/uridine-2'-O-)-methyltransferase
MDYIDIERVQQHENVSTFLQTQQTLGRRIILATPDAPVAYHQWTFQAHDTLVMGRESTGFPQSLKAMIQDHIMIPMYPQKRSINLALAAGIILGEALRQLDVLPSQRLEPRQ